MNNHKFMQVVSPQQLRQLQKGARERGIDLQEFLRAVVIAEWLIDQKAIKARKRKRKVSVHAKG